MEFSPALDAALRDRRTAFLDVEAWVGNRAAQDVHDLEADLNALLGTLFFRHSSDVGQADGSSEKGWDALALAAVMGFLQAELAQRTAALSAAYIERLSEEMMSGLSEGYDRALWELAIAGVETEAAVPMEQDEWLTILGSMGFEGVTASERAQGWIDEFTGRIMQQLKGSVIQGESLASTMTWASLLTAGLGHRLATLAQNELHRAWTVGVASAQQQFEDVPEVWVTRLYFDPSDRRVCSICLKKHMTITEDQPIDDSHPGCRCVKVPVTQGGGVEITSFEAFRALLHTRERA